MNIILTYQISSEQNPNPKQDSNKKKEKPSNLLKTHFSSIILYAARILSGVLTFNTRTTSCGL
jgi:hypothetical protein